MKKIISSVILLVLFTCIVLLVLTNNITWLDEPVYNYIISYESDTLTDIFKVFTFLGSTKFIIIFNILIFVYTIIRKKYQYLIMLTSSLTSVIFNNIIKIIIERPRPNILRLIAETGYSFPSGHAMISILFYGSIIYIFNKYRLPFAKLVTFILVILIGGICLSRIYLGVHYVSDVLGGMCLATSLLLIVQTIYENKIRGD